MFNKMTHTGSGNVLKVFDHGSETDYLVNPENVFDMRQADLLIGDVSEVIKFVKRRHPYSNIVLVHGCNCMNNMGAGLARRIAELYPQAVEADNLTKKYDESKLGTYSHAWIDEQFVVANLYTQFKYGGVYVNVDYPAVERSFEAIVKAYGGGDKDTVFVIPKFIGCGLAGGDYNIIEPIVSKAMTDQSYYLFDNK